MRRTKIGELNFTGEAHASACGRLAGGGYFRWLWAIVVAFVFFLGGVAFGAFPPALVIDAVVCVGTPVSVVLAGL